MTRNNFIKSALMTAACLVLDLTPEVDHYEQYDQVWLCRAPGMRQYFRVTREEFKIVNGRGIRYIHEYKLLS